MIHLDIRRDRVTLSAPWSPSLAADCRSITGWSFTKDKLWTYPLNLTALRSLRAVFGKQLKVSPGLNAWAKDARAKELALQRLSRKTDARLKLVPEEAPRMAAAMEQRTYQRVGAAFGARAGSWLCADEPGLGKTLVGLAAIIEAGEFWGEHLIVAPKAALDSQWRRQIRMWTDAQVVVMPEGRAKREKAWELFQELEEPKFLVVNLAMMRRQYGHWCPKCDLWKDPKKNVFPEEHHIEDHRLRRKVKSQDWPEILDHAWNYVILDESHEALAAYTPGNISQQTQGLLDLRAGNKIALTGTPLRGSETRIWGTADWLGIKTGGYWGWVDNFFESSDQFFGGKLIHGLDPNRTKAFHLWLDGFVLRRTRAEVRPDLPLGQRIDVMVSMTPRQRAQYEEFRDMGETALEAGLLAGQGVLSELTRLKQLAFGLWNDPGKTGHLVPSGESPKLDFLLEFLRKRGVTGKPKTDWLPEKGVAYKYVVASQFTEVLDAIERNFEMCGISTMKITGAVTGKRRTDAIAKFQSNDKTIRVCLIQTKTGGVAIDLDAWCDEMVILDETFVADDQVQLEGRTNNRSGRVSPRSWYYVRTEETIDQTIAEGNYMQHDLQHNLLDGRRGVKTALHLIRGGR